jgi:hypothetical protein
VPSTFVVLGDGWQLRQLRTGRMIFSPSSGFFIHHFFVRRPGFQHHIRHDDLADIMWQPGDAQVVDRLAGTRQLAAMAGVIGYR